MDKVNKNIIKEIAEHLDCGNDCYYNLKTEEIIAIPNFDDSFDEYELGEAFGPDLDKIKKQKADFIKFEVLKNFESFEIMERFVDQLNDEKFKSELENVLHQKKPFQNFKRLIDYSDFRQNWFDFKQMELEKIVEDQMNIE